MGNTPNHNIYYLSSGDPQSQITESATQAGTIEAALDGISGNIESVNNFGVRYFSNASARDLALTNPEVGWLSQLGSEEFIRRWDGSAWRPYGSGMYPIRPGSVAGTGVIVDDRGAVIFSGASSITVGGVFSSEFRHYQIHWFMPSSSTATGPNIQLRSGSTTATANYRNHHTLGTGSVVSASTPGATNHFQSVLYNNSFGTVDLYNPALAAPTWMRATWAGSEPGTGFDALTSGTHTASTSFDGLVITSAAGTFTGDIRFFGVA